MVRLISSLVIYPIGIRLLMVMYHEPGILAACLLALSALTLCIDRRPGDVWVLVGGAVLGPLAEIFAVRAGAWTYAYPGFHGIPVWLPVAWGLATLLIKRISEGLVEIASRTGG